MTRKLDFGNLSVQIDETLNDVTYKFSGIVNEHFKLQNLPQISKPIIKFDLSEIESFNSCGIREWLKVVNSFTKIGQLNFYKCSINTIDQINMVPDAAKNANIISFFAPYYCETDNCENEVKCLIEIAKHKNDLMQKNAPEFHCDNCKEKLEFDALEESYFLFLDLNGTLSKAS